MATDDFQDKLRYHVNRFIFDHGFAPDVKGLSQLLNCSDKDAIGGLRALADNHAIVLHPGTSEIWVAHPFALFPTLFWVKSGDKQWWSNCTWCSLGVASLTKNDTDVYTKLKGEVEPLKIEIRNGRIAQDGFVVHFPIPAAHFWDNVIYTCSMMLVFRDENEIDAWCKQHNKPKGEVLPITQVWELAKVWYGNYLDPNFKRKTKEVAENIFESVGLTSTFWKL